jgi:hypothetical protein
MRRISMTALLAVPLLLFANLDKASAAPTGGYEHFGFAGCAFKLFPHMHQHGPLFNYGPYYGYYPFKPYGPWDAYLRYDPYFYGDPYAKWDPREPRERRESQDTGNMYGRNKNLRERGERGGFGGRLGGHGFGAHGFGHQHGCLMCGFWHASWLHGGWFRGHAWLGDGVHGHSLFHKSCKSCGGVAVASPVAPIGDVAIRYSGFGEPSQSAVFYSATPTLDPTLELLPTPGQ